MLYKALVQPLAYAVRFLHPFSILMYMDDCIFCKIARGEISAEKVYEDDSVVAFLDIHPKGPGHTLVVPKAHSRWFYDMPDELSDQVFRVAKKLAQGLRDKYGVDMVRLSIVGDEVPHTHIHLIPTP